MDKKALMEKLAGESYEKGGFNGAWLYAEKGEIVSKGAFGFRDPEDTLPITEDTVFQLASVSKTFTSSKQSRSRQESKIRLVSMQTISDLPPRSEEPQENLLSDIV